MQSLSEGIAFSGSLRDTAWLVGLCYTGAPIQAITYCGEQNFQARRYVSILNEWLKKSDLEIDTSKKRSPRGKSSAREQLKNWGWGEEECIAAIRLAGLPLPPGLKKSNE